MKKRLISCYASDIAKMSPNELKDSIIASEGRVILGETVVTAAPLLEGVTNPEVMAAFGADMIVLNEYDVFTRYINGMEDEDDPINTLKTLTGKPIGINLEPVDQNDNSLEDLVELSNGRIASKETFMEAARQHIDFINITGNPASGVSNESIKGSIVTARQNFPGLIFAGKMHGAGLGESPLSEKYLLNFIELGADGIIIPAVGTVPGVNEKDASAIIKRAKEMGAITIAATGTSQESADPDTIRAFGLSSKRIGADIHHLGDGGYGRMAEPENYMALSICICGKRHTYKKMSLSINR